MKLSSEELSMLDQLRKNLMEDATDLQALAVKIRSPSIILVANSCSQAAHGLATIMAGEGMENGKPAQEEVVTGPKLEH